MRAQLSHLKCERKEEIEDGFMIPGLTIDFSLSFDECVSIKLTLKHSSKRKKENQIVIRPGIHFL